MLVMRIVKLFAYVSTSRFSRAGVDEQCAGNPARGRAGPCSRGCSAAASAPRPSGPPTGRRPRGRAPGGGGGRRRIAARPGRAPRVPTRVAPKIARASSVRPAPMSPANPRISPACSSKLTSLELLPAGMPRTDRSVAPGGRGARREHGREGAVDHHADHLVAGSSRSFSTVSMRLPSRNTVMESQMREDLVDLVRDVQDRDALRLQPADEREQALDLVAGERGGGLVHDEDLRVCSTSALQISTICWLATERAPTRVAGVDAGRRGRRGPPPTPAHGRRVDDARRRAPARGRGRCSPPPTGRGSR